MVNQGLQQLLNDDDAGHRITGHSKNDLLSPAAQNGRLAGLDGDAMVQHLTQFPDDSSREILPSGRRTGIENYHIALVCRFGNHFFDLVKFIRNNGIDHRLCAPGTHHCGKNGAIEFQNIPGLRVCTGRDNLVPCGDDAHHRFANHFNFQHTAGNHRTNGSRGNGHMAGQNHFPGAYILADLADMLPRGCGCVNGDGTISILHNVLHHDDCIFVLRNRVAGVQHKKLVRI